MDLNRACQLGLCERLRTLQKKGVCEKIDDLEAVENLPSLDLS